MVGACRVLPCSRNPDLAGYVVLDFTAFDAWYEEDERNVAHPRDPFHRIDTVPSSRHVRLEMDGAVRAESSRPTLLFETMLPPCFYLPPNDVEASSCPARSAPTARTRARQHTLH